MDTLDLSIPHPVPGADESEYHTTRNFTYFTKLVRNVRRMNNIYARIKKKKEWGIDPDFVQLNPSFEAWMSDLPNDLQITFPPDGSLPWLPSHFIGNLHSYYYLGIIMLHRPQLTFMEPTGVDGGWKHHMMICYSSAKLLCRLQESILQSFGMPGLLCMQRGINYSIYCILTCTVLHLVSKNFHFQSSVLTKTRSQLLLQIRISIEMPVNTSLDTCGSLRNALAHGPCLICSNRSMHFGKRSLLTLESHLY
jgi:hypothetical protein